MIYMSAQSDDDYFLWQLEVQLENFASIGLLPENIHVLIGFNPDKGLNKAYTRLTTSGRALFFTYPDDRKAKEYKSSIRPHILRKHFQANPDLTNKAIFYHDCDVIFRERLNEELLESDDTWYLSATPYISHKVLDKYGGRGVVNKLCKLIGITRELVEQNEADTGGAQYVLKNLTSSFWEKVERDCEAIHSYLLNFNIKQEKSLQAWCSDMWAVLWNGLLFNYKLKVHQELDFCWPKDNLQQWLQTKILHNSGVIHHEADTYFCKGLYINHTPFYTNFGLLAEDSCSRQYTKYIEQFSLRTRKEDLKDITFIFAFRVQSQDGFSNLDTATRYILKHFDTNVHILEIDDITRINKDLLAKEALHYFVPDKQRRYNAAQAINDHLSNIRTPILCICDPNCIIPADQLTEAHLALRNSEISISYPFDRFPRVVAQEQMQAFKANLDATSIPEGKPVSLIDHYYGGYCFMKKDAYIKAGRENPNIRSWGTYNYQERSKRMAILGMAEHRTKGGYFLIDSYVPYVPEEYRITPLSENLNEYLRICSMQKEELENVVVQWQL